MKWFPVIGYVIGYYIHALTYAHYDNLLVLYCITACRVDQVKHGSQPVNLCVCMCVNEFICLPSDTQAVNFLSCMSILAVVLNPAGKYRRLDHQLGSIGLHCTCFQNGCLH